MSLEQRINCLSQLLLKKEIFNFDNFLAELQTLIIDNSEKITYLYLILLARYPSVEEIEFAKFQLQFSPIQKIADFIKQSNEYNQLIKTANVEYQLIITDSNAVYLDSTGTLYAPFNTGIQRVARSLFENLINSDTSIYFYATIGNSLRPYLLPEQLKDKLLNWNKEVLYKKNNQHLTKNILNSLRTIYKQFFANKFVDNIRRPIQEHFFNQLHKPKGIIQIPVFKTNSSILLVEVLLSKGRESLYASLNNIFDLNLSMIIYDLLPITRAEFFTEEMTSAFAEYLKLLRYVDKISCISASVQLDVENFIECLNTKNKPLIKTHLLAGLEEQNTITNTHCKQIDIPLILSIGTIEPRKNHLNLLRSAYSLWEKGLKFKLHFIGVLGWKSASFIKEFTQYQKKYPEYLQYLNHIDDNTLKILYKECKATVFISWAEGFGLPILESLSSGKPCITTNYGSMKEIADKTGGCILVNPSCIEDIAKSLEVILIDQTKYNQLKEEINSFQWHSWKDYSKEILDFVLLD